MADPEFVGSHTQLGVRVRALRNGVSAQQFYPFGSKGWYILGPLGEEIFRNASDDQRQLIIDWFNAVASMPYSSWSKHQVMTAVRPDDMNRILRREKWHRQRLVPMHVEAQGT